MHTHRRRFFPFSSTNMLKGEKWIEKAGDFQRDLFRNRVFSRALNRIRLLFNETFAFLRKFSVWKWCFKFVVLFYPLQEVVLEFAWSDSSLKTGTWWVQDKTKSIEAIEITPLILIYFIETIMKPAEILFYVCVVVLCSEDVLEFGWNDSS